MNVSDNNPFRDWINTELDVTLTPDIAKKVEAAYIRWVNEPDARQRFYNRMTPQQRQIHAALTDIVQEDYEQSGDHIDRGLVSHTIVMAWLILLEIDETILRKPYEEPEYKPYTGPQPF
jgi:hypothetical protein